MFPLHLPSFCLCDCETVFANCLCVGGSWLDSIEYFTNRWCMWLCTYVCLFVAFKTTCAWVDFLKNMLYRNTVSCCFSLSWLAFFLSRLAFRFFPFLSPFFSSISLSSLKTCFDLFFFFYLVSGFLNSKLPHFTPQSRGAFHLVAATNPLNWIIFISPGFVGRRNVVTLSAISRYRVNIYQKRKFRSVNMRLLKSSL